MFARRGLVAVSKLAKASIVSAPKAFPQTRFLSMTIPRHSTVATELAETLKEEIAQERQIQQETKAAKPTIPGFEIKTKGAEVTLTKKQGNATVKIVFDVSHSVDPESEEYEEEQSGNPVSRPPLEFQIIKGDKKLVFDVDLIDGEESGYDFSVQEFYLADAKDEKVPEHVYRSSGGYIDPGLGDLLFKRYLEENGLNDETLEKIVEFATHFEHEQYIQLLEGLKGFVEK